MDLPDDYILIRADELPKDTLATALDLACQHTGQPKPTKAAERFDVVWQFIFVTLQSELVAHELDAHKMKDTSQGAAKSDFVAVALDELHRVKRHYNEVYYGWNKVTL